MIPESLLFKLLEKQTQYADGSKETLTGAATIVPDFPFSSGKIITKNYKIEIHMLSINTVHTYNMMKTIKINKNETVVI